MRGWNSGELVESLESRRLLASIVLFGGVLEVRGDNGSSNYINVKNSGDNLNVEVSITSVNQRGQSTTVANTFPKAQGINGVTIRSGKLADGITVDEVAGLEFTIPVSVNSGGGNDTVRTASGIDIVDAGGGDDTVNSGPGSDTVRGQGGHDVIDTGLGVDRANSGAGNDVVRGGEGDDFLRGSSGNDQLFGGPGDDQLSGEAGVDQLYGEDGNDRLNGAAGNDFLFGHAGDDTLSAVLGVNVIQGGIGRDRFVVRELRLNAPGDYDPLLGDTLILSRTEEGFLPAI